MGDMRPLDTCQLCTENAPLQGGTASSPHRALDPVARFGRNVSFLWRKLESFEFDDKANITGSSIEPRAK